MSKEHGQSRGTNNDPLAQYLKDVSSLPRLTPKEEILLARRVRKGDREALRKLVEGNLRFVVHVATSYHWSPLPFADLVSEGNIGLIKAAERFDPERGVKFITYAVWWIKSSIGQALAKQVGVIGLPLKHAQTVYHIHRKEDELSKRLGRAPTKEELFKALGLPQQKIESTLRANCTPISLDAPFDDNQARGFLDTIKTDGKVGERLEKSELSEEVMSLVESLERREQEVINMRFGLNGFNSITLREIGENMGRSKERIRQIEAEALERMRKVATNRKMDVFL